MARSRRRRRVAPGATDVLVLDADGVTKLAAGDRSAQAWLERAHELDAEIVVCAVTVAEVVRGAARDARTNRILKAADMRAADEALARRAGALLGNAGSDATLDSFVAATALVAVDDMTPSGRCVLLTSDPGDLAALLGERPGVRIVAV